MIGVYSITCNVTGKIYVGKSRDVASRFKSHLNLLKRGKGCSALQADFNKYGSNAFSFSVLKECRDLEELDQSEVDFILKLKTYNRNFGYNTRSNKTKSYPLNEGYGSSYSLF